MPSVCVCIKQSRAYASLTYAPIIHLYQIPSHVISKNYNDLKNTNSPFHYTIYECIFLGVDEKGKLGNKEMNIYIYIYV